jgi:hypothetical protein
MLPTPLISLGNKANSAYRGSEMTLKATEIVKVFIAIDGNGNSVVDTNREAAAEGYYNAYSDPEPFCIYEVNIEVPLPNLDYEVTANVMGPISTPQDPSNGIVAATISNVEVGPEQDDDFFEP